MSPVLENIEELWIAALKKIESKISKPSFDTWLKSTVAEKLDGDTLIVNVPNEFARDWLEGRYTKLITDILYDLTGAKLTAKFIIPDSTDELGEKKQEPKSPVINNNSYDAPRTMLNPKYTFDSFVIGAGNRFAHAASLAVAEAPAKAYNPLFIYGGVGLGKKHLMHAIGHYVQEHDPNS